MTQRNWWGTTLRAASTFADGAPGTGQVHKAVGSGGMIAPNGHTAIGLSQFVANSGEHLTVGYFGEMDFTASQALTAHQLVTVTTSGYVAPADSGSHVVGRVAELAVGSGAVGRGLFDFMRPYLFQDSRSDEGVFTFNTAADLTVANAVGKAVHTNCGDFALEAGGKADGILVTGATSGGAAWARTQGRAQVRAGGVIIRGASLAVADSGWIMDADSGDVIVGRALAASAAGNSGSLFAAAINFATPPYAAVVSDTIT